MSRERSMTLQTGAAWRGDDAAIRRRRVRYLGRAVFTLAALLALAVLGHWLIKPFQSPRTHLVLAYAAFDALQHQPVPFTQRDRQVWQTISNEWGVFGEPLLLDGERLLSELAQLATRSQVQDRVILSITSHGISRDGKPVVLAHGFTPQLEETSLLPLEEILAALNAVPAATKLLIVDAGSIMSDPRIGAAINHFTDSLAELVHRRNDPRLWVLVSHATGQVSGNSPSLAQTVFAHAVQQGLSGGADTNQDGTINVSELHQYVESQCQQHAAQSSWGQLQQSPQLMGPAALASKANLVTIPHRTAIPTSSVTKLDWTDIYQRAQTRLSSTLGQSSAGPESAPQTAAAVAGKNSAQPPTQKSEESSPETSSRSPYDAARDQLALLVAEGWLVRDSVRANGNRPADVPHRWMALQRMLVGSERICRFGNVVEIQSARRQLQEELAFWRFPNSQTSGHFSENASASGNSEARFSLCELDVSSKTSLRQKESFTGMLAAIRNGTYQTWRESLGSDVEQLESIHEFRIALTWMQRGYGDDPILAEAVALREIGEATAKYCFEHARTPLPVLEEADTTRLEAERLLLERTRPDWLPVSRRKIESARQIYHRAQEQADVFREARYTVQFATERFEHYCDWFEFAGTSHATFTPSLSQLIEFEEQVLELADLLSQSEPHVGELTRRQRAVTILAQSIEQPLHDLLRDSASLPSDALIEQSKIALLLATPLPDAELRQRYLVRAGAAVEPTATATQSSSHAAIRSVHSTSVAATHNVLSTLSSWQRDLLMLQIRRIRMRSRNRSDVQQQLQALTSSIESGSVELPSLNSQLYSLIQRQNEQLVDAISELGALNPTRVATATNSVGNLLCTLDPRDSIEFAKLSLRPTFTRLTQGIRNELQQSRLRRQSDVGGLDREYLRNAANDFANRFRTYFPGGPAIQRATLQVEAPTTIDLVESETQQLGLSLQSDEAGPCWIALDFDTSLLEIQTPDGKPPYTSEELPAMTDHDVSLTVPVRVSRNGAAEPAKNCAAYQGAQRTETMRLDGGKPAMYNFAIRRRRSQGNFASVVVSVRTPDDLIRRTIRVELPGTMCPELLVQGPPGSWSRSDLSVQLHPLPNQTSSYTLSLVNHRSAASEVDVELFAIGHDNLSFPEHDLTIDAAQSVLAVLQRARISSVPTFTIPPHDSTPIPFPKLLPPEELQLSSSPLAIDQGFVVAITDKSSNRVAFRPGYVAPQRPRRYTAATANYDHVSGKIRLQVESLVPDAIPKQGIRVAVDVRDASSGELMVGDAGGEPPALPAHQGVIPSGSNQVVLEVPITRRRGNTQQLEVSIDYCPRAFLFAIPTWQRTGPLPEITDRLSAVFPVGHSPIIFSAATTSVPVSLHVDVPPGSWANSKNLLRVGLDMNRDRELKGDPQTVLRSDRDVRSTLIGLHPTGGIDIATSVSDITAEIALEAQKNVRANLLCQLEIDEQQVEGRANYDIVLDSLAPIIERAWMPDGDQVGLGDAATIHLTANDRQLSGVARVEGAFDVHQVGEFTPEATLTQGEHLPGIGWSLRIPTKELELGKHTVLLRAVDYAANNSDYHRVAVQVVDPSLARKGPYNSVIGKVMMGTLPGASFQVALRDSAGAFPPHVIRADENGNFRFPKIPVGTYQLTTHGLLKNMVVTGSKSLEVLAPPAAGNNVEVPVRVRN